MVMFRRKNRIHPLIQAHFKPVPLDRLSLTERRFPHRVRADLQRAVEDILGGPTKVFGSYGLFKHYDHQGIDFAELLIRGSPDPAQAVPPLYEEIDIGEDRPVRCLKNGLWLLDGAGRGSPCCWSGTPPSGRSGGCGSRWPRPTTRPGPPSPAGSSSTWRGPSDGLARTG